MAHKILGGWSLDGVFIYQSGAPFSIGTGADYAGVGPGGGTQYWVVNGPLRVTDQYSQGGAAADPNFYFQPTTSSGAAEFTPPPAGTINPQRVRDMFYGPGAWYTNSALFKEIPGDGKAQIPVPLGAIRHPQPSQLEQSQYHSDLGRVWQDSHQIEQSRPATGAKVFFLRAARRLSV